ncbi:hypothetical protein FOZ63_008953 [Perkinsus olseni]|uniref:Uncharacterized protein n=1 Tax=Perkinsus olseni TaxID=32597 RepID=A0A7J6U0C6_PEROL|nr:hypothetical protein FOZ63_008953 [Perkinsus olseni]
MIRSQGINMNAVGKGGGRGGKGGKGVGKGKGGGVLLAKKGGPPWRGGKGLPIANATAATRKPPKPSLPEVDLFLDSQEPATAEQLRKEDRTIRKQMYGNLYDVRVVPAVPTCPEEALGYLPLQLKPRPRHRHPAIDPGRKRRFGALREEKKEKRKENRRRKEKERAKKKKERARKKKKKSSKAKSVPGGSGGNKVGDDGTGNIREEEEESGSELASLHSSGSSSDDSSNNSSKDGSSEDQESDDTVSESSSESSPSSSSSSEEEKQAKSFYVPNEITDSYTQTLQPPELPPPFGNLPGMLNVSDGALDASTTPLRSFFLPTDWR